VPLSHISDAVYKTSVDWINHRSPEALSFFLLWSLDSILADLSSQLTVAKGSKKAVQQVTSKSQVTYISLLCHEIVVVFFYFKFLFFLNKI
jgi:COX assembly protein 1